MIRSVNLSLKYATQKKRQAINALLQSYRSAVNFYIKHLWDKPGKLDKETLARLPKEHTRLSARFKSQALKQALEIVSGTKKAAKATNKKAGMPIFNGPAILDAKFITIEDGLGSFDVVIHLSTLRLRHRITIPTKKYSTFNKWMSKPGAVLIQGCRLTESGITVFIEVPEESHRTGGESLGIDIGVNKLIATSDGDFFGEDFKVLRDKIMRKKPGSKAHKRACQERTNYINRIVNELPWASLSILGIERLLDMKRGKQKDRSKSFRKAMAPWTYRQVITRIENKAQENRVRLVDVDPRNTSRGCPECGVVSKENRKGEDFVCISCGYAADADSVGAHNVLTKALRFIGSLESPGATIQKGSNEIVRVISRPGHMWTGM